MASATITGHSVDVIGVFHVLLFIQIAFFPFNITSDDTWYGWEELSEEVDDLSKKFPDSFLIKNKDLNYSAANLIAIIRQQMWISAAGIVWHPIVKTGGGWCCRMHDRAYFCNQILPTIAS